MHRYVHTHTHTQVEDRAMKLLFLTNHQASVLGAAPERVPPLLAALSITNPKLILSLLSSPGGSDWWGWRGAGGGGGGFVRPFMSPGEQFMNDESLLAFMRLCWVKGLGLRA